MSFGTVDSAADSTSATNGVHSHTCTIITVTKALVAPPSQSNGPMPIRPSR
jgi:hypothetical protein